jgi:hypothetical protein
MFPCQERFGEALTRTIEQGGIGVRNGYLFLGLNVKGTRAPFIFRRLTAFTT